jgi:leucyl-tRNA synthetase
MAYDHLEIEPRWQRYWAEHRCFETRRRAGHPKLYALDMFPYPSGSGLHVGHPEGYTATDIIARYKRMCGFDVLHPMGWDAFGLPAEQHAIQTGTHPRETTKRNIDTFRRQLQSLGFSYDWSREVDTTDPNYVRWTQWIFLKLFHRGLAFQAEIPVNWCPALGTVLANEEVVDGVSERGGHPVVRQPLRQWQLRITAYADRLAADLEPLDWPETKQKQREWIGRSEGALVDFPLDPSTMEGRSDVLTVFTTRPDTLFGATYMVIAPDHPLTLSIASPEQLPQVKSYAEAAARKSDMERTALGKEKTGIATGAFAKNPLTGARIPIFTADYVLGAYGTGAIMAVPAHDERDFEFAKKFDLPIVEVVSPDGSLHDNLEQAYTADGIAVRSGAFDGLKTADFKSKIIEHLVAQKIGKSKVQYKLRDWVFSRQRYWGEPIPVYFPVQTSGDPRQGAAYSIDYSKPIAVAENELPLLLPELDDYHPGDPQGPLAKALDWRFFQKDGQWYARETNTMPQWAGSCWYYLRYLDPHNATQIFDPQAYADWMPVDLYVGGSEHAVLHLLYARFWHKVLFDEGIVKDPEPFQKLVHQGMILGASGEKMSKARGNVVNPDDVVRDFGADSLRCYEMFMGPFEQVKPWQTSGIQGVRRFLDRVHKLVTGEVAAIEMDLATAKLVHRTVKKVTEDIDGLRFNTAVSTMMILSNHLQGLKPVPKAALEALVLCLSPYAPHLAEEAWTALGHPAGIGSQPWPSYDPALCIDETVEIPVQVNGKVRGRVTLARDASEEVATQAALAAPGVSTHLQGKTLRKVAYVPGRIINLIVG